MVPNVCKKTHKSFFWRSHQKRVLYGRKFVGKSHTKLFGQVGGLRAKILRMPKNLPAPTGVSRGWPKIYLQGGQEWQNFISTTRNKENNFSCKTFYGKMSNFNILGALPSHAHAPKPFYNRKAEENNKHIFSLLISINVF